ncbi:uncharacterized protein LOC112456197, partial [Temnothorax curvispinosus]|uniref:Uncharacterized protein LOC112456197 n=1 Tax=Temnothorax curvispinosus TaxID=300111 RepID=A0A6J1PWZ2_9HYME
MASSADSRTQSAPPPATNELLLSLIEQMKLSDSKISAFIESQQRTNEVINSKLDLINSLSETVANNTQRISSLELENAALKRELHELKTTRLDRQDDNASEIIVSGLPEPLSVAPSAVARNVLVALGAPDISPHILNVRAVRRSLPDSASTPSSASVVKNSLIITVTSNSVRDLIISKKRAKGVLRQGEVCGNDSKTVVHINELLSKDCYELLQQTKRLARERAFSKAFDTVPHLRLLIKLKELGFSDPTLIWLFSYLTGRSQAVADDEGNLSSWLITLCGVPQGSVLGPPLFTLYINDIDANAIFDYANVNGLKLNPAKSKVIIFGSGININNIDLNALPPIIVNHTPLPYRVHHALYKLKFSKNSLSTELRIKLVTSLVLPHLDYCCLVYHGLSKELNLKLQRL